MNKSRVTHPDPNASRLAQHSMAFAAALLSVALAAPALAQTYNAIDVPGYPYTHAFGINDFGLIVGDCDFADGYVSAYVLRRGNFTIIDAPDAVATTAWDINNLGAIVGDYYGEDYLYHGFLYVDGKLTTIDFPGAVHTSAQGIDDFGRVVGIFIDNTDTWRGFILVGDKFRAIEAPNAEYTTAVGITGPDIVGDMPEYSRLRATLYWRAALRQGVAMAAAGGRTRAQNIGLALGLAALISTLVIEPPAGLSPAAWQVAGTMALMAIWWATEALPFAATALVPICLLPPLGAARAEDLAHGYGNTTLYLILGGFLLGLAMERCNLHRRIAYAIVARAGGNPEGLVLGMLAGRVIGEAGSRGAADVGPPPDVSDRVVVERKVDRAVPARLGKPSQRVVAELLEQPLAQVATRCEISCAIPGIGEVLERRSAAGARPAILEVAFDRGIAADDAHRCAQCFIERVAGGILRVLPPEVLARRIGIFDGRDLPVVVVVTNPKWATGTRRRVGDCVEQAERVIGVVKAVAGIGDDRLGRRPADAVVGKGLGITGAGETREPANILFRCA